ncbi:MAG: DUF5685 family protein [Clostridia bacterium]|nr:DUF5685 family protein [Clostridia bacterium]
MFGYVKPYLEDLQELDKRRYKAVYCGLCRALGERHGVTAQMNLTYDMTFLAVFLSSLYEVPEQTQEAKCLPHPGKTHMEVSSGVIDYCADMTVLLSYHKCMDDWQDEHKISRKTMADLLKKPYERVRQLYPDKCAAIERLMGEFSAIEKSATPVPDAAAICFGQMLEVLFLYREDFWRDALCCFSAALGQFIYLMDAVLDYRKDEKSGSYNPLVLSGIRPEDIREPLMVILGQASRVMESLPLVQDESLIRNIIYSGVWQDYNKSMQKQAEGEKQ